MCNKLIIASANEDWQGIWHKDDVEKEMKELDSKPKSDGDWLYWVLEHVFDSCKEFDSKTEKFIAESDILDSAVLKLEGFTVTIWKK